jgi:hypothetical protein
MASPPGPAPSTPPRGIPPGTQPGTPTPIKHIPYDDHQDEFSNLSKLEDGNSIDILRTNNDEDKVVRRELCYFGTTKAGIKIYLKANEHYHKWTLPKDRLFDLTDPKNYDTVVELRNTLISENEFEIKDIKNNLLGTNKQVRQIFDTLLIPKKKTNESDKDEFERTSDEVSDDTVFFKFVEVKLNELLQRPPGNSIIGTYTKRTYKKFHAEVVIWDEKILGNIHSGKAYIDIENDKRNPYDYFTIEAERVAPQAQQVPPKRRRLSTSGSQGSQQRRPLFEGGGKRKAQGKNSKKKTKKRSKSSNKKRSVTKKTKSLHRKNGGSYKKKTKKTNKQRRKQKKGSLKNKRK